MSGHTPGPWAVHPRFRWLVVPASDTQKNVGGSVNPNIEAGRHDKQIAAELAYCDPQFHRSRVMPGEAEANAILIAAAPAMLEALEAIELFLAEELAVRKGSYEPDPTPFDQALIDDAQKALDIARDAIKAAGDPS
jgi:hypothetical protein